MEYVIYMIACYPVLMLCATALTLWIKRKKV